MRHFKGCSVSILITNAFDAIRERYQDEEGDKGHLLLSPEEEDDQVVLVLVLESRQRDKGQRPRDQRSRVRAQEGERIKGKGSRGG